MKNSRGKNRGPELSIADPEARKRTAMILEVMGGLSTPSAAAAAAGMSLPRYYALEKKALEGLAAACAPLGRRGRRASPEREVEGLRERVKRLEREASRNLALLRASQRAAGWTAPLAKKKPDKNGGGRKPRRPAARALAVAESLRRAAASPIMPAMSGAAS
jgi:hypothetical protein